MTNYGPQTAEVEALIERVRTTTVEQATALAKKYRDALCYEFARSLDAAKEAEDSADRYALREAAWHSAGEAAQDAVWTVKRDTNCRATLFSIRYAVWALVVKDLITAEEFEILYGPWASVMDKQTDEQRQLPSTDATLATDEPPGAKDGSTNRKLETEIACRDATIQGLIAALAIKNEKLDIAERESLRWKKRAKKAKAELAKFQPCDDSNGCYDDCGRVHVYDAEDPSFSYANNCEMPRAVYHKEGE
jgi:hypothetical protein